MKCKACGGVAHPSTGAQYSETYIICGPCVRDFWSWVRSHTNRSYRAGPRGTKKFVSFYEAAGRVVAS